MAEAGRLPNGRESMVYSSLNGNGGATLADGVTLDAVGNPYGTTLGGGTTFNGVIYWVAGDAGREKDCFLRLHRRQ